MPFAPESRNSCAMRRSKTGYKSLALLYSIRNAVDAVISDNSGLSDGYADSEFGKNSAVWFLYMIFFQPFPTFLLASAFLMMIAGEWQPLHRGCKTQTSQNEECRSSAGGSPREFESGGRQHIAGVWSCVSRGTPKAMQKD